MSALVTVRDALVAGLQASPLLAGVQVSAHGGDFTADDLKTYSKRAPALIVALLSFDAEIQGGTVAVNAHWGMVAIAKNAPAVAPAGAPAHATDAVTSALHTKGRHVSVLALADAATRAVIRFFYGFSAPYNMTVSAPRNLAAVNEYSPKLDAQDIALWGLSWDQHIDLVDVPSFDDADDLTTVAIEIDTYPRPAGEDLGDVPEAEDLIEDLDQ